MYQFLDIPWEKSFSAAITKEKIFRKIKITIKLNIRERLEIYLLQEKGTIYSPKGLNITPNRKRAHLTVIKIDFADGNLD